MRRAHKNKEGMNQVILPSHTSPQTSGTLKWGTAGAHMSILTLESLVAAVHKLIYTFDLPTIMGLQFPPYKNFSHHKKISNLLLFLPVSCLKSSNSAKVEGRKTTTHTFSSPDNFVSLYHIWPWIFFHKLKMDFSLKDQMISQSFYTSFSPVTERGFWC